MTSGPHSKHKQMDLGPLAGDEELMEFPGATVVDDDDDKGVWSPIHAEAATVMAAPVVRQDSNERTRLLPPQVPVRVVPCLSPAKQSPETCDARSNGFGHADDQGDASNMLTPPLYPDVPHSMPAVTGVRNFNYGTAAPPASASGHDNTRRHSILRANSARSLTGKKGMRKSPSVEFRISGDDEHRRVDRPRRPSIGRDFPRRLTTEEKEELYRVRPDLEIGPVPFFQEQLEEMRRQSQRRMLVAIFGGMFSMLLLMMVYYLLTKKYKGKKFGVPIHHDHHRTIGMIVDALVSRSLGPSR